MDIRLALMAGTDIPMPELGITLRQPRIREIALMGDTDFNTSLQYLCLDKESLIEDESRLESLTNFQVLMKVIEQSKDTNKKKAIITFLNLIFVDYTAIFTPRSILLTNLENQETVMIDDNNFEVLQEVLREVFCVNSMLQGDNVIYKPINDRAQQIAEKMMRGRRRVAEIKAKESQKESAIVRYLSILTIGCPSMSLEDNLNLTIYQLFDLIERYMLFTSWDSDMKIRLAGGTPNTEAETWMKNIH